MTEWRAAGVADADALTALERDANLVALAHVFPPDRYPFPWDGVRERWVATLQEPGVVVEVVDGDGRLDAFVAHDGVTLRHLGVHPDRWGQGLARAAVDRAAGAGATRLWCLVDNHRARGLYDHLGFAETGGSRQAPWPPYPTEVELSRSGSS
ncbi:GNAT family N-acetyltransferase [Nocardioides sp. GXQ0305]|uniref:GNAT family N-acetyltransferase n=1 Tax=Nocardioides sp. GXQ0305 TaxID=3423912 RepID=UPI003D7ED52E